MDYRLPGSSVHGDSPCKNTGVGCYALLHANLPNSGSNPGLPHCLWILLTSEPPRKPCKTTGAIKMKQICSKDQTIISILCKEILVKLSKDQYGISFMHWLLISINNKNLDIICPVLKRGQSSKSHTQQYYWKMLKMRTYPLAMIYWRQQKWTFRVSLILLY